MPEVLEAAEIVEAEKTLTPSEVFAKYRADKAAGTLETAKPAEGETAKPAEGEAKPAEKRASGDERKFRRALSKRDQEIGELRARVDMLTKPADKAAAAATVSADAPPKREAYNSPEEFQTAMIAFEVKKQTAKEKADADQNALIKTTIEGYNARIAAASEKYSDWAEVMEAGKGAALNVDLNKECPALFWAIASSPNNDDLLYAWLKDSTKLQELIDLYKTGPEGEQKALIALNRFEGKVAKDAPAKAKEATPKADDAVVKSPKPKPSADVTVKGGETARNGARPEVYLKGTHTLNPEYKAWMRQQRTKAA